MMAQIGSPCEQRRSSLDGDGAIGDFASRRRPRMRGFSRRLLLEQFQEKCKTVFRPELR